MLKAMTMCGVVTIVQEGRFQMTDDAGVSHLFILAHTAAAEPQQLDVSAGAASARSGTLQTRRQPDRQHGQRDRAGRLRSRGMDMHPRIHDELRSEFDRVIPNESELTAGCQDRAGEILWFFHRYDGVHRLQGL